jgi:hypothetical protein
MSTYDVGIEPGAGYANIMAVLAQATPEELDYWGRWYHHAKDNVTYLADRYGVDPVTVAAVVAVLSPGNKWFMNLRAAEAVIQGEVQPDDTYDEDQLGGEQAPEDQPSEQGEFFSVTPGEQQTAPTVAPGINAYPANIAKAQQILATGDTSLVTGPKVTTFFQSLLDPQSIEDQLVLDGHAINLWRGTKRPLKGITQPNKEERERMLADYERAAQAVGLPVQSVQAVTWYIWKHVVETPQLSLFAQWVDQLEGGAADERSPGEFDEDALASGIADELEHTDDPSLATEIAMDHLVQDEDYYDIEMEHESAIEPPPEWEGMTPEERAQSVENAPGLLDPNTSRWLQQTFMPGQQQHLGRAAQVGEYDLEEDVPYAIQVVRRIPDGTVQHLFTNIDADLSDVATAAQTYGVRSPDFDPSGGVTARGDDGTEMRVFSPNGEPLTGVDRQEVLYAMARLAMRSARLEAHAPRGPRIAGRGYYARVAFAGPGGLDLISDERISMTALGKLALHYDVKTARKFDAGEELVFFGSSRIGPHGGGRYVLEVDAAPEDRMHVTTQLAAAIEGARRQGIRHVKRLASIMRKVGIDIGEAQLPQMRIELGSGWEDKASEFGIDPEESYEVIRHNFKTDEVTLRPTGEGADVVLPADTIEFAFVKAPGLAPAGPTTFEYTPVTPSGPPVERSEEEWEAIRQKWQDVTYDDGPGSTTSFEPEAPSGQIPMEWAVPEERGLAEVVGPGGEGRWPLEPGDLQRYMDMPETGEGPAVTRPQMTQAPGGMPAVTAPQSPTAPVRQRSLGPHPSVTGYEPTQMTPSAPAQPAPTTPAAPAQPGATQQVPAERWQGVR